MLYTFCEKCSKVQKLIPYFLPRDQCSPVECVFSINMQTVAFIYVFIHAYTTLSRCVALNKDNKEINFYSILYIQCMVTYSICCECHTFFLTT